VLRGVSRRKVALPERGVEIALLDWGGDGPLAFLHHANGFCAALWDLVAERLRERFRVVAMDARGHGDSSSPQPPFAYHWELFADDLVAVAERVAAELGRPRVEYGIGHSFGGTCTLIAAARRPELFGRIAMVDPVLFPPPDALPAEWRRGGGENPMIEMTRKRRAVWTSRESVLRAWSREGHAFASWDPRALELYVLEGFRDRPGGQVELKCRPEVEASVYANNQSLDPFSEAANVRAPALLLWAKRGNFPRAIYEAFVARMPDARIEDVDAGHLLPMEAPDVIADALLRFAPNARAMRRPASASPSNATDPGSGTTEP
jgi:pimeloyl-ACP methyl ester carboxylesterase